MLSNEQMQSRRFERWANARKLYRTIVECLSSGGVVQVTTYTRSTLYKQAHLSRFSCGRTGVYVLAGKQKVDISLSGIRFGRYQ